MKNDFLLSWIILYLITDIMLVALPFHSVIFPHLHEHIFSSRGSWMVGSYMIILHKFCHA